MKQEYHLVRVNKGILIKEGLVYCNFKFFFDEDIKRIKHAAVLLSNVSKRRPSYLFEAGIKSEEADYVESNIDLSQIREGIFYIGVVVDGKEFLSEEYIDTSRMADVEKTGTKFLSIHIPKTAGTTFGTLLREHFGHGFFRHVDTRRFAGASKTIKTFAGGKQVPLLKRFGFIGAKKGGIRCLHGHYPIRKYKKQYPSLLNGTKLIAGFRDPAKRVVSHYEYIKRAHPYMIKKNNGKDTFTKEIIENNYSLSEYAGAVQSQNVQFKYINPLRPGDFHIVIIQEEFDKSVRLVKKMLGIAPGIVPKSRKIRKNKSPIAPKTKALIYDCNQKDLEIYLEAKEYFNELCSKHGIE